MCKCPHCGSEVTKMVRAGDFYCNFCEMVIQLEENKPLALKGAVDHVDAFKSTRELMNYHTFDLLLLLGFTRQERRSLYSTMQVLNRVKHTEKEFMEGFKEAFKQYDYWTKKTKAVESLVRTRIGFIPKAVTNELLENFYNVLEVELPVMKHA